MKFIKALLVLLGLLLGFKSDQGVRDGICDYSGQGRDEFGK